MNGIISLFAIVFSLVALIASVTAVAMVLGMKWSTHKIEWKPLEFKDPFLESNEEMEEIENNDNKTLEEALNLQRKAKKAKEKDPLEDILETNNF